MPVQTVVDRQAERLFVTFEGPVAFGDIEEMITTSGQAGILHFPLLVDAQNARFALLPADINKFGALVQSAAAQSKLGKTAVLVSDPTANGIVHMLSLIAGGLCDVKGFRERESAERWLGW